MRMEWKDITLGEFQMIWHIANNTDDEMEKLTAAIGVLFNMTESEVNDLTTWEFNLFSKEAAFVFNSDIPGKPKRIIKSGLRLYGIQYDVRKLRYRQSAEVAHFSNDIIGNMHYLMASIVQPIAWYGKWKKNEAKDHERIAEDMLQVRFIDVYHACVFFCNLFRNFIKATRGFLEMELSKTGMDTLEAHLLLTNSIEDMDGFFQRLKSEHWKE
jgi:hypothetical protein